MLGVKCYPSVADIPDKVDLAVVVTPAATVPGVISQCADAGVGGAIIISASGMCEGGRIKHHLRYNIGRAECAIVFAGFQAAGTLGRRIVDGAKPVRIFGEPYAVRAKVFTIGGLSAHADRDALLGWAAHFREPPGQCWVVHGEPGSALALRDALVQKPGWRASVPVPGQSIDW